MNTQETNPAAAKTEENTQPKVDSAVEAETVAMEKVSAEPKTETTVSSAGKRAEHMLASLNAAVTSRITAIKENIPNKSAGTASGDKGADPGAAGTGGAVTSATSRVTSRTAQKSRSNPAHASRSGAQTVATAGSGNTAAAGAPRRVKLTLTRIEPWSVMKFSFLVAVAFGIASVIAAALLWNIVDSIGLWDQLTAIGTSFNNDQPMPFMEYFEFSKMMSYVVVVSVVNVIVITALGTMLAFLYNIVAALLGGLKFTFTDR